MTEEEARAERVEAERLVAEINSLVYQIERAIAENKNLQIELEQLIRNIEILTVNAESMDIEVNRSMEYIKNRVQDADIGVAELFEALDELTSSYFTFKNLSTATKNVTQYTDEYYTKFKFFNELRRISLGYVIGLDAHICSDETMRKKVEKIYLQNTDYWLAYAIMSVMLWARDEREAAKRALSKSLKMDYFSTSLFFLLINLRFTRVDAAKQWYLTYLDRVDTENLGQEWKYLLQAYLSGVFGIDEKFDRLVHQNLINMLEQMESMHPDYGKKVTARALSYSKAYIHVAEGEFETLRRNCPEYKELKGLLSDAEKNEVLAQRFKSILEDDSRPEEDIFQRIENILYDLINGYDREESKVIREQKRNEMIIKAKGDLELADQFFKEEFPADQMTQGLSDLLFDWAFEEEASRVNITVKSFSLSYLKTWIAKGFSNYAEEYRKREKEKYKISIDGWEQACDEHSYETARSDLEKHYNKNRTYDTLKDKYVQIFIGIAIAAVVLLAITVYEFNPVSLVVGILLGALGGFLLWRRITDMQTILRMRREQGCLILKKALEELGAWRKLYKQEDAKNTYLVALFEDVEI